MVTVPLAWDPTGGLVEPLSGGLGGRGGVTLGTISVPCPFSFWCYPLLPDLREHNSFVHKGLPPCCSCLGASQSLTESPETISQTNPPLNCVYQLFCSSARKADQYNLLFYQWECKWEKEQEVFEMERALRMRQNPFIHLCCLSRIPTPQVTVSSYPLENYCLILNP